MYRTDRADCKGGDATRGLTLAGSSTIASWQADHCFRTIRDVAFAGMFRQLDRGFPSLKGGETRRGFSATIDSLRRCWAMSGPIVRSGPSETFTTNWGQAFAGKKKPVEKASAEKKTAAKSKKKAASKPKKKGAKKS